MVRRSLDPRQETSCTGEKERDNVTLPFQDLKDEYMPAHRQLLTAERISITITAGERLSMS